MGWQLTFVEITQKLIGMEYELGKMDCFSLILHYADILKYPLPKEYKGLTRENYKDLYLENPLLAKEIMIDFMIDNFKEIPLSKMFTRDILLLEYKNRKFLAINGGNGNIIGASEKRGISAIPLKFYKILKVFKCQ